MKGSPIFKMFQYGGLGDQYSEVAYFPIILHEIHDIYLYLETLIKVHS
jgi:hypothetical protein